MEINQTAQVSQSTSSTSTDGPVSKQTLPQQFERLFARQLVQELTKGLFENNKGAMSSGSGNVYKQQIVDILSSELADQQTLGIADSVEQYLDLGNRKMTDFGHGQQVTER